MTNYSCSNLSFSFGKKVIFKSASFDIKKGDVVALVGANGSGKTSFLKILGGLYQAKNYQVSYRVTYMLDKFSFYPFLTGYQNLKYYAMVNKIDYKKIREALHLVGLYEARNLKFKKYSFGMKQKLSLARMLILNSDMYLFDEPLNGLDPSSILKFKEIITYLSSKNKTIIISSHILKEISQYTNKTLLIHDKKILSINSNRYSYYLLTLENVNFTINLEKVDNQTYKYYQIDNINEFIKYLITKNVIIKKIKYVENNIEEIFRLPEIENV